MRGAEAKGLIPAEKTDDEGDWLHVTLTTASSLNRSLKEGLILLQTLLTQTLYPV